MIVSMIYSSHPPTKGPEKDKAISKLKKS